MVNVSLLRLCVEIGFSSRSWSRLFCRVGWCELVAIEDGHISIVWQLKGCVGHRRWAYFSKNWAYFYEIAQGMYGLFEHLRCEYEGLLSNLLRGLDTHFRRFCWPVRIELGIFSAAEKVRRAFCELYLVLTQGYGRADWPSKMGIFVLKWQLRASSMRPIQGIVEHLCEVLRSV